MPDIFKARIAETIATALGPLLFDVTLIKVTPGTRTGGSLTAGTNPTAVSHTGKGFVDDYTALQVDDSIVRRGDRKLTILGASLPDGVIPLVNDKTVIEGETKVIVHVRRDPAGATYECQVR